MAGYNEAEKYIELRSGDSSGRAMMCGFDMESLRQVVLIFPGLIIGGW